MNHSKQTHIKATLIIDEFEELLDSFNITLPSNDREGREVEARIYGEVYYNLEEKVMKIIDNEYKDW